MLNQAGPAVAGGFGPGRHRDGVHRLRRPLNPSRADRSAPPYVLSSESTPAPPGTGVWGCAPGVRRGVSAARGTRMTIDSAGAWIVVSGVVVALLVLDFVVAARRPHAVGMREATAWTVFYIGVAIVFGLVLWWVAGAGLATEYFAGWMVEKSLSVDNLFVFVIIMARFSVPPEYQQKVLLFGIATALAMRTVLIVIGAAAISLFSFTFVVFGLLLIWTAVQLVRHRDEDPDIDRNPLVRRAGKIFPMTDDMRGGRLLVRENGKRMATPLFVSSSPSGAPTCSSPSTPSPRSSASPGTHSSSSPPTPSRCSDFERCTS